MEAPLPIYKQLQWGIRQSRTSRAEKNKENNSSPGKWAAFKKLIVRTAASSASSFEEVEKKKSESISSSSDVLPYTKATR
ncbi:hypothetical protein Bca52824_022714 [Brassica carinata]|uniref:Uncharacterized protein n=1 Tax=Brassica carinata TaxID=52824 RepID=A0A8X8AUS8_BRACI|nr:hypothetical protein Bca52824_022714 [Brassica carinata]